MPEFLSDEDADDLLSLDELNETPLADLEGAEDLEDMQAEDEDDAIASTPAMSATAEDLDADILSYLDFGEDDAAKKKGAGAKSAGKPEPKGTSADRRKQAGRDENETLRAPGKPRDDRR
jgi:hypothetical protein